MPFGDNWVLYAESTQGVDDAVADLTRALLVGVPMIAGVLGLVVWFVVGRTLLPVQEALDRERRLVADVTHELRTPLAGARALLESESQILAEIELNRLEALAALTRLESMADDLLVEARNDGVSSPRLDGLVDLDDVAFRVLSLVPHRDDLHIDVSAVSGGQVRGNERDLERMIANLLANAVRHADRRVRLTLVEEGAVVTLTVADDGPGIPFEDCERIFERFTRLDDARGRDSSGAGLGLPIVRSVVLAHDGTIEVGEADMGGAAFIVRLPSADRMLRVNASNTPLTEPDGPVPAERPRAGAGRVPGTALFARHRVEALVDDRVVTVAALLDVSLHGCPPLDDGSRRSGTRGNNR
jgi:signal transduction histidine kinase